MGLLNTYVTHFFTGLSTNGKTPWDKVETEQDIKDLKYDVKVNKGLTIVTIIAIAVIIALSIKYSPYISLALIVGVPLALAQVNGVILLNRKLQAAANQANILKDRHLG